MSESHEPNGDWAEFVGAALGLPEAALDRARLAGDASNRTYYRVRSGDRSWILMVLADLEPHRQSEEIGESERIDEIPFLNVAKFLREAGLPVPEVMKADALRGWVLLEDLGERTLYDAMAAGMPPEEWRGIYRKAIDLLARFQRAGEGPQMARCCASQRRYDAGLFDWEFDHYLEWALEKGPPATPAIRLSELRGHLHALTADILALPPTLVHRDFHAKNLMWDNGQLGLIDFQDALWGPPVYDLASLLGDAYWEVPDDLAEELIERYEYRVEHRYPHESFMQSLHAATLQRQLKAVGRFYYLHKVKDKPGYLPFVPSLLRRLRETLDGTRLGTLMTGAGAWKALEEG